LFNILSTYIRDHLLHGFATWKIWLANRDAPPVGKRWVSNFVKRHPELKTHQFQWYDTKEPDVKTQMPFLAGLYLCRT
jgi:hypothetical protein